MGGCRVTPAPLDTAGAVFTISFHGNQYYVCTITSRVKIQFSQVKCTQSYSLCRYLTLRFPRLPATEGEHNYAV